MVLAMPLNIVVLEGDQTGQELLEQALRVLDPDLLGMEIQLERFDLSLENRENYLQRSRRRGRGRDAGRRPGGKGRDDHS